MATSDAAGRYRITGLHPGQHIVCVEHAGYIARRFEGVDISAAGASFDVALTRGVRVAGRVLDADGAPAIGAVIQAHWGPFAEALVWVRTDASGRFVIEGVPATATVDIMAHGDGRERDTVYGYARVAAGTEDIVFDARDRARLCGRLVDDAGQPIARCVHGCASTQPGTEITGSCFSPTPDGRFDLHVVPGAVEVLLLAVDVHGGEYFHTRLALDLAPREERADLVLAALPVCELCVEVRDAETNAPIAGAKVGASSPHHLAGCGSMDTTDAEGRAILSRVRREDDLDVTAGAAGYARGIVCGVRAPRDEPVVVLLTRRA